MSLSPTGQITGTPSEVGLFTFTVTLTDGAGYSGESELTLRVTVPVSPPADLLSWWPANGDAKDAADGNDGVPANGATFAAGKAGQAFSLDGKDDFVQISDAANLDITDGITIDAWIKPTKSQIGAVVAKFGADNGTATGYGLIFCGDWGPSRAIETYVGKDGSFYGVTGSSPIPLNEFTHVAMTYDGNELNVFVDGELDGSSSTSGPITPNDISLTIGATEDRGTMIQFFKGAIDEVDVFERALSEEEIEDIFNAGSAGKLLDLPPSADAGPDQSGVEAISPEGAMVNLDGTGSTSPSSQALTYTWTGPFGTAIGPATSVTLPLGTHTVSLTVQDNNGDDSDTTSVTVVDTTPPTITAPPALTVEADMVDGAAGVVLGEPTVSDVVDSSPGTTNDGPDYLPMGMTAVTWTATDDSGNSASATQYVTVVDTAAPRVTAVLVPIDVEDDEGLFRVEFSYNDTSDGDPSILSAVIVAGGTEIPVSNGQVVELELDEDLEVEMDDGVLEIEAPSFTLVVECADGAGNVSVATATPEFDDRDDDDDDDDDDD